MNSLYKVRDYGTDLIKEVNRFVTVSDYEDLVVPDGCWDFIVAKDGSGTKVMLVNRPLVLPTHVPRVAGSELLTITLTPGAFIDLSLPLNAAGMLYLPLAGKNTIWLGSKVVEIPTFDNAETFAKDLRRKGYLRSDNIVLRALANKKIGHERTQQRHFKRITGMTLAYFRQVERAHAAARQLRHGVPILQVAHDQGYSDQFHLSKSLRRILGQTPSSLRRSAS